MKNLFMKHLLCAEHWSYTPKGQRRKNIFMMQNLHDLALQPLQAVSTKSFDLVTLATHELFKLPS